jgi:long-chain acyl-CoA synthetase
MNLVKLADSNIEKYGKYTQICFDDKEYSNIDIIGNAKRLASGLKNLGIKKGDKVVVMLPNCPEVFVSYQAILRTGAVIVPMMHLLGPSEMNHILSNSEAVAIITAKDFLEKIEPVRANIKTLKHIIILGDDDVPGTTNFNRLIIEHAEQAMEVDIAEDDLALILYTAGTTGTPKGVMLTHGNFCACAINSFAIDDKSHDDTTLFVLPLSHVFGFTQMNIGYLAGNKMVLLRRFELEETFRAIEKYKVTDFSAVPAMIAMMLNSPLSENYDLSSLKTVSCGSAPLPAEVLYGFQKKFNIEAIREGYGLSETGSIVSVLRPGSPQKPGSVGQLIPSLEIRLVDDYGNEVAKGEIGEITLRGPSVFKGYYKMPEETAKALKDGWLYTGDMGRLDEDGYLYIVERKKDLIIRGGFNIYPRDVEEVLYTHPAVLECAVVGVPDAVMGEQVKAYVVLREGHTVTEEELIKHTQEHLAKYKTPKYVEFVSGLPKNPMGKVLRKELRAMAAAQLEAAAAKE